MDYHELVYGLIGLAVCGAVLAPLLALIVKTVKSDRAMRRMTAEELSPEELSTLRLTGDVDTVVIPRPAAPKALGQVGGVAPQLRRAVMQPRQHRYNPEIDRERSLIARLIDQSSLGGEDARVARAALSADDTATLRARLARDRQSGL